MAAGATYVPIATANGTGSSGTIDFTSVPSTYTDLILIWNYQNSTNPGSIYLTFNNDTGTNYSGTYMDTNGPRSYRVTNQTGIECGYGTPSGSEFWQEKIQIMNYSNTTTYKTALGTENQGVGTVSKWVSLWRNTAAINRVTITAATNFVTGSTFTLYGIASA
jgi:hypothetical protein